MTNAEIIAMLSEDIKGEHMAIVQYLRHAYAMGEGELAAEVEAIAREEMRHFDWLAELIVELGGKPTLERGTFTGFSDDVAQNMRFDVVAEQGGIALYRQHIEAIADPKIRRLLARILSDEESHLADFEHFVDKAEREKAAAAQEGATQAQTAPVVAPKRLSDILNAGIRHEYSVVLQYLYHSHFMPTCDAGNELEMQAINEMQHLGWLAEELESAGGTPDIEHTELQLEGTPEEMLKNDIKIERAVAAMYSQQIPEVQDEGLKTLLARIRDHEIYHAELFSDLEESVEKVEQPAPEQVPAPAAPKIESKPKTIGSLFGKEQS